MHKHKHVHLPGYPIETMPADGQFYLVSIGSEAPGAQPYVLARRERDSIIPMFTSGSYQGAKFWHPFVI